MHIQSSNAFLLQIVFQLQLEIPSPLSLLNRLIKILLWRKIFSSISSTSNFKQEDLENATPD